MLPSGQDCTSASTHPWIWLLLVGLNVGDLEGCFVGLGVGDFEGLWVGSEVGFAVVGEMDGASKVVVGSLAALGALFDPPVKRFATGDGVVIRAVPPSNSNDSDSIEMATSPKASSSNDFIYDPSSSDVSCKTSIMYDKCKPEMSAGPLTVMRSGIDMAAKRRRLAFLVFCIANEEERRRRTRPDPLLSSKATSINSTESSKFVSIVSLTN